MCSASATAGQTKLKHVQHCLMQQCTFTVRHYCPQFVQLTTLAHTLLQMMWLNVSLISFLTLQLRAEAHFSLRSSLRVKDNMLGKLTLIQVWPAVEILSFRNSSNASGRLVNWWVVYFGWGGCWHCWPFSISSLVRWRCLLYLDLFKSRTGIAISQGGGRICRMEIYAD